MSMQISASSPMMTMGQQPSSMAKLSDEQKENIESILASFDAEALSEADAKELVSAFQDAGIQPSKEFAEALDAFGFDAREIGNLAGVGPEGQGAGGPPPPSSGEGSNLNQDNLALLQEILEQYTDIENLGAQEQEELSQALAAAGLLEPGALIDTQS